MLITLRIFKRLSVLSAALLVAAGWLVACQSKDVSTPVAAKPPTDALLVQIPSEMIERFLVAPVQSKDLESIKAVAGRIEANDRLVTRIGASVTGRVTEVLVEVGDRVQPGQALARVASPELAQAQMAYLRAHSASALADRAVERARQLFQADVIGSAELQRRESEQSVARAEQRAAQDQLRLLGVPTEALARLRDQGVLHPYAEVVSSLSGVVIERKVSNGQVAQPGDPLFTVADLSRVWVVGDLPEQTARTVQVGQRVDIEVPALDGHQLSGKIVHVGDTVSPETRTVLIRTQVDNARRELKPQMLATMRIRSEAAPTLVVPVDAVVREGDKDHVFVRKDDHSFYLTQVDLGTAVGAWRPVIGGVREGQEIVVQGAFHMNNERKRAELE